MVEEERVLTIDLGRSVGLYIGVVGLVALILAPSVSWADTIVPAERVINSVNVRSEPRGGETEIVGKLRRGESAELLESVAYYYKIQFSGGIEGYVHKS